ncbi:MAG: response regulator [Sphingobacteriaceae bacterium]|nr:MAG: response regulator [Sphingobacteriaceae bacterium]
MELSFIVIDDSELDCFVARKIIELTDKSIPVKTYQNGRDVINQIRADFDKRDMPLSIILLDLRMPVMNGFQFVDEFEKFPLDIKRKYQIHILSSSKNTNDLYRISTYDTVISLIEKPFTREKLMALLTKIKTQG